MALDVTPQGNIYICRTPLEVDMKDTLNFESQSAQRAYFESTVIKSFDNSTYIRKESGLRVNCNIEEIRNCNYLYFRNTGFSDQIFYCFITDMRYLNENSTYLEIEEDPWQTWYWAIHWHPCLVEREHVKDDTIGANLYPEGLEIGDDYVIARAQTFGPSGDYWGTEENQLRFYDTSVVYFVTQISLDNDNASLSGVPETMSELGRCYNGEHSGCWAIVENQTWDLSNRRIKAGLAQVYNFAGIGEAIVNAYAIPKALAAKIVYVPSDNPTYAGFTMTGMNKKTNLSYAASSLYMVNPSYYSQLIDVFNFYRLRKFGAYTPHNNKLLTYPYTFMHLTNNAGASTDYKYEDFTNEGYSDLEEDENNPKFLCSFALYFSLGSNGSMKVVPLGTGGNPVLNYGTNELSNTYKGIVTMCYNNGTVPDRSGGGSDPYQIQEITDTSFEPSQVTSYGLTGAKFPTVSWNNDSYTNWLTQNGVNIQTSYAKSIVSGVSGILGRGESADVNDLASPAGNLLNTALTNYAAIETAQNQPNTAEGSVNSGDVVFGTTHGDYTMYQLRIREQYAKVIDEYFDRFGYKVNRLKIPEVDSRLYWNYIKTVEANITGYMPQKALNTLRKCLNRGITIWHDPESMYDYTKYNAIATS